MIKTILSLGGTPRRRRLAGALILFTTAIASSALRNGGQFLTIDMASNLAIAAIVFGLLHFRWRNRERRELTPGKLEDTFS